VVRECLRRASLEHLSRLVFSHSRGREIHASLVAQLAARRWRPPLQLAAALLRLVDRLAASRGCSRGRRWFASQAGESSRDYLAPGGLDGPLRALPTSPRIRCHLS
jgi:hypothetical protein